MPVAPAPVVATSGTGWVRVPCSTVRSCAQQPEQLQTSAPSTVTGHAPIVARQLLDVFLDDQLASVVVVRSHLSSSRARRRDADSARKACLMLDPTTGSPFVGGAA